jgi:hypothetical protein
MAAKPPSSASFSNPVEGRPKFSGSKVNSPPRSDFTGASGASSRPANASGTHNETARVSVKKNVRTFFMEAFTKVFTKMFTKIFMRGPSF